MVNKYIPHVWLIPEDDANRQIAVGFKNHFAVSDMVVGIRAPAGGWQRVLHVFESEYLSYLRNYVNAHVVMLIDFDDVKDRKLQFQEKIPNDVRSRVFVVGSKDEPESLKVEVGMTLERIGRELAQDCLKEAFELWRHPHLIHNSDELQRLVHVVKPILFPGN